MDTPIIPEPKDHLAVERDYGPLAQKASEEELAHRYRLLQAAKLIRLIENQ